MPFEFAASSIRQPRTRRVPMPVLRSMVPFAVGCRACRGERISLPPSLVMLARGDVSTAVLELAPAAARSGNPGLAFRWHDAMPFVPSAAAA